MQAAKKLKAPIIIVILLGLTVRSFIASGLMLMDIGNSAGLSVALCPTQNRGIDFDILRDSNFVEHHHVHGNHSGDGESKDTGDDTHLHTEGVDPACLAWLSTGGDALQFLSNLDFSAAAFRDFLGDYKYPLLASQNFIFNGPRGPPSLQLPRSS